MDERDPGALKGALAVLGLTFVVKTVCAAAWDPIADEALYWQWSQQLDLGYFDQPPLVAWLLAASMPLGQHPLALRLSALLCGALLVWVLTPHAKNKAVWWLWCATLPPLWWLTLFMTPDAPLLLGWAVALAGALAGGTRGWLVVGLAAGWAFEAKYTGALLFPLLFIGAGRPWRAAGPGAVLAAMLALPNLLWNVRHDWVTLRFQTAEGWSGGTLGVAGPMVQVIEQWLVCTPVLGMAGYLWCGVVGARIFRGQATRLARLCWWASAPLLVLFALSAVAGTPEAHWPAPAWVAVGLGLSHEAVRWRRAVWIGSGFGLVGSATLVVNAWWAVLPPGADPTQRISEGRALSQQVAKWALPIGVAAGEPGARDGLLVWTERYQEASLIAWHTGLPTAVFPGCGRPGQHTLRPEMRRPSTALFVRPRTSGPPRCMEQEYPEIGRAHPLAPADARGRSTGPWDLFEVRESEQ